MARRADAGVRHPAPVSARADCRLGALDRDVGHGLECAQISGSAWRRLS